MEYACLTIVAVILAKLAASTTRKWLFRGVAGLLFLVITIPAAIRYGIGIDYLDVYLPSISHLCAGFVTDQEKSFSIVVKIIMELTEEPHWVFVFYSTATYLVAILAFPWRKFHYVMLVYMLQYYTFTYCDIRQGLSLSFVIWTILLFLKSRFFCALVACAIAVFWHKSSAIILPILVVSNYLAKKEISGYIIWIVILAILLWAVNSNELILKIVSYTSYARYLTYNPKYISTAQVTSGLGYIIPAVALLIMSYALYYRPNNTQKRRMIAIFCGVGVLFYAISVHVQIIRRFCFMVDSIQLFAVWELARIRKDNRDLLCLIFVLACLTAMFTRELITDASFGVQPYTTIFDYGIQLW